MGFSGKGAILPKKRGKGLQIAALHGYIARTFPSWLKHLKEWRPSGA
jgi:hypothetical protein